MLTWKMRPTMEAGAPAKLRKQLHHPNSVQKIQFFISYNITLQSVRQIFSKDKNSFLLLVKVKVVKVNEIFWS